MCFTLIPWGTLEQELYQRVDPTLKQWPELLYSCQSVIGGDIIQWVTHPVEVCDFLGKAAPFCLGARF